ncbi:hypothetical protein [Motiliproteus sediminis]|uniref:hypothetical protein n=1 Tax=Motiliproteus sediminis TaxID=1468178 RepID=UPI001AEFF126|nr:hypothetical protein [Motiliproteus sediminis]
MFLITSGAYIDQEFVSEIGLLPPSFLPVGNRCLYEYQIELAERFGQPIYLSIPASFELSEYEQQYIEAHQVELIRVPEGLSLGQSVLYCLNMTGVDQGELRILHGDTLYPALPEGLDLVSVSPNTGYYRRAMVNPDEVPFLLERMAVDDEEVLSGFFAFSCARSLVRYLAMNQGGFVPALSDYHLEQTLTPLPVLGWYDFGHINAYFGSRAGFTTQRSFNALQIDGRTVVKSSDNHAKVRGEIHWFSEVPPSLSVFAPKLLSSEVAEGRSRYTLEYVYNLPLSDLFVFGRLAKETWRSIFHSCRHFMSLGRLAAESATLAPDSLEGLYLPKTLARLRQFGAASGWDIDSPVSFNGRRFPSPLEMAEKSSQWIGPAGVADVAVVHGDFCFSNILYDFRTRRIKVVDPRGIDLDGKPSIFGDQRYDYAKLYHSVHGLYDLIVAGRLEASGNQTEQLLELRDDWFDYHQSIKQVFEEVFFGGQPEKMASIRAINVHLFLSMLPLHADRPDRQLTMLANAYRLYAELEKES